MGVLCTSLRSSELLDNALKNDFPRVIPNWVDSSIDGCLIMSDNSNLSTRFWVSATTFVMSGGEESGLLVIRGAGGSYFLLFWPKGGKLGRARH